MSGIRDIHEELRDLFEAGRRQVAAEKAHLRILQAAGFSESDDKAQAEAIGEILLEHAISAKSFEGFFDLALTCQKVAASKFRKS